MAESVVEQINLLVKNEIHFEFDIYSYNKNALVIVGSEDLLYFHVMEIHLTEVVFMLGNTSWHVDPSYDCISIVDAEEFPGFGMNYHIEKGVKIFKFRCDDTAPFYVVAKDIRLEMKTVKYYEE